ncbi:MAG: glutathione S-transferase family protein [Myxococcota bacterium]|nr:glutathione S-transferase family protein [Myxococcota bacterium]
MDLYFSTQCGNSKRVLFTLAELGVEVTEHPLDMRKREHRSAEYLAVNPLGKVPSLVDGPFVLWESNAIALYLAERFPDKRIVPESPEGRAELHKWLFYLAYEVGPPAWKYFFNARGFEMMVGVANPEELTSAEQALAGALEPLEHRLSGRGHLLGEFSLADIAFTPSFANLVAAEFDLGRWPRLQSWVSGLLHRPAWGRANNRA